MNASTTTSLTDEGRFYTHKKYLNAFLYLSVKKKQVKIVWRIDRQRIGDQTDKIKFQQAIIKGIVLGLSKNN